MTKIKIININRISYFWRVYHFQSTIIRVEHFRLLINIEKMTFSVTFSILITKVRLGRGIHELGSSRLGPETGTIQFPLVFKHYFSIVKACRERSRRSRNETRSTLSLSWVKTFPIFFLARARSRSPNFWITSHYVVKMYTFIMYLKL